MAKHAATPVIDAPPPKKGKGRIVALVLLLVALCVVACAFLVLSGTVKIPGFTDVLAPAAQPSATSEASASSSLADETLVATEDADLSTAEEEAAYYEAHKGRPKVHPLIAQCSGIDLRSPIAPADITGVLFHQASYAYALVMTTQLPEADAEKVENEHISRVNNEQIEGEWLDADAMHLWRMSDATDMDTSIDVGASAGTVLRSPVTGTVVLVKDYMLYDEVPDIEIHIQPEGRPDLDVVLLHTYDPFVKAGDKVEAGVTELSHVRDIAKDLDDVQLAFYTDESDPGNHTHVQVNNADYEDYRKNKLAGAITVQ